jgi:putative peptidoglycan lipid II flippase
MHPSRPSANRQIARAAGTVMVTFVFGKAIGLFAYLLLGRTFGTGADLDAYLAANRFSDTLFTLVAGGALASAFIPTFTTLLAKDDRESAWRLASAIANLVIIVLVLLGILGAVFAPWVVRNLLARGFEDPQQIALTVRLLRIQVPSAVIFGLSGLVMGILNGHQRFLYPALAPSMYQVGIIFGVLALAPSMGIEGAAWGVVIGALLHLLVQIPQLAHLPQRRYTFSLGLRLPMVREVLILMGPRLIGVAVVNLNFWVNIQIASHYPGGISALTYGFVLMMMPQAAIAQSIAIASLPTFSAQAASGRLDEMRASLAATLRAVLLLALPATLGLILLRQPLVAMLYQRGEFTEQSTQLVAWALLWYSVGLVGHCIVEIVSRAFYALHDTKTPVTVGVIAMGLNVVFSLLFSRLFEQIGVPPHGGLALANSLATGLEMIALLYLMNRRLQGLEGASIWRAALLAGAASAAMSALLWVWLQAGAGQPNWLLVSISIMVGGLAYLGLLIVLRVREIRQGWSWLASRLAGRL